MDINPNTERLVSTCFVVLNAVCLIIFHSKLGSPIAVGIASIITITAIFLLLSHESDFQSVRLGCAILPLAVSVAMPKKSTKQSVFEAILMAAPVISPSLFV